MTFATSYAISINEKSLPYLAIITLQLFTHVSALLSIGPVCPIEFEGNSDFSSFDRYCNLNSFSLARIPAEFREDICYSKCLVFDTCAYYVYDVTNTQCVVCLRNHARFGELHVGAVLQGYSAVPTGSVNSRTGMLVYKYL